MKIKSLISVFSILLFSFPAAWAQEKKNSRPAGNSSVKVTESAAAAAQKPVYFYEFEKAEFLVPHIRIEHDETGAGKIVFQKKNFEEEISDPLRLSEASLKKIKGFWTELDFLNSEENYQSPLRDYGHLGTIKLSMEKNSRKRSAKFNWSENLPARALADEYRKIANQFVWMFDINVSRQNQPLESPRIMRALDSYLTRNAISDPAQMIPFLKELSEDERMPLIARNHAGRLIKRIEKEEKKKEESAENKIPKEENP